MDSDKDTIGIGQTILSVIACGAIGGAIYHGCVASRTIEDAVVTETGTYKSYYDADSPVYDSCSYIKINTKNGCFDTEKIKMDLHIGDHLSIIEYKPINAIFAECDYNVLTIKKK